MISAQAAQTVVSELGSLPVFYSEQHQAVYDASRELVERGEQVDLLTVSHELRRFEQFESPQMTSGFLVELTNATVTTVGIENHCRILIEYYQRRQLDIISFEIKTLSYYSETPTDIIRAAGARLLEVGGLGSRQTVHHVTEAVKEFSDELNARADENRIVTGIPTGFSELDRLTSGWQPGEFIIIAARPSIGKTSLSIHHMLTAALNPTEPRGVLYFSIEMPMLQITTRLICTSAQVDFQRYRRNQLSSDDLRRISNQIVRVIKAPIYYDESSGITAHDIRSRIQQTIARHSEIKLVIVDYVGKIRSEESSFKNNATHSKLLEEISSTLQNTAKQFNVACIILSQLNRGVEARADKRPMLSDLRDSGSLEQDANVVILIHRPNFYGIEVEDAGESTEGKAELIVAKSRNGSTGSAKVFFNPALGLWYDPPIELPLDMPPIHRDAPQSDLAF